MNCLEFLTGYYESGLTPELEKHLRNCPACRLELECEKLLTQSVRSLQGLKAPDALWPKINDALNRKEIVSPVWNKISAFASGLMHERPKPALIASILILALATGISYYYFGVASWDGNTDETAMILEELKQSEDDYLAAIEKLARLVEGEKNSISPEFYLLYREKLNLLDMLIARCKDAIRQNRFNTNAHEYLFAAYKEKVETLKMISEKSNDYKSM